MPKVVDKALKRRTLVEAATEVFKDQGYAAATMEAIARRAGVAKGTLYLYFENKEDLFLAVFDAFSESILARAGSAADATHDAETRLRRLFAVWAEVLGDQGDYAGLLLEFWAAAATGDKARRLRDIYRDAYRQHREFVAAIIRDGQARRELRADMEAEALAAVLVGGIDGLWLQVWFDPALDAAEILEAYLRASLAGWRAGGD